MEAAIGTGHVDDPGPRLVAGAQVAVSQGIGREGRPVQRGGADGLAEVEDGAPGRTVDAELETGRHLGHPGRHVEADRRRQAFYIDGHGQAPVQSDWRWGRWQQASRSGSEVEGTLASRDTEWYRSRTIPERRPLRARHLDQPGRGNGTRPQPTITPAEPALGGGGGDPGRQPGSFLFLVLVARSAPPAVFGGLGALAALTLVFEVPANALQVAVGRTVGVTSADGRVPQVVAGPLLIEASAFGAGACAVLLAVSPLVERFLHLPSITSALLLGAYALPVGLSVVPKGVLAGQGRWPLLSTGLLAGMAVRLVVGVVLVRRRRLGAEGAFVAMVWGEVGNRGDRAHRFAAPDRPSPAVPRLAPQPRRPAVVPPAGARPPLRTVVPGSGGPVHLGWGQAKVAAVAFTGYWALSAVDVVLGPPLARAGRLGFVRRGGDVGPDSSAGARGHRRRHVPSAGGRGRASSGGAGHPAQPAPDVRFGFGGGGCDRLRRRPRRYPVGLPDGEGPVRGAVTLAAGIVGAAGLQRRPARPRDGAAALPLEPGWPGDRQPVLARDPGHHRGRLIWHRSMTEIAMVMVVATSAVCAGMLVVALGHAEGGRASPRRTGQPGAARRFLDLTVVVPYYNPGQLLVPTIERLLSVLDDSGASYEVVAVSDGSTDGSDRNSTHRGRPSPAHQPGLGRQPRQGRGPAHRPGPGPGTLFGLYRRRR